MERKYNVKGFNQKELEDGFNILHSTYPNSRIEQKEKIIVIDTNLLKEDARKLVESSLLKIKPNGSISEIDLYSKAQYVFTGKTALLKLDELLKMIVSMEGIDDASYDSLKKVLTVSYEREINPYRLVSSLLPKGIHLKPDTFIKETTFYVSKCSNVMIEYLIAKDLIIDCDILDHTLYVKYKDCSDIYCYLKEEISKFDGSIKLYNYTSENNVSENHLGLFRIALGGGLLLFGRLRQDSFLSVVAILVAFIVLGHDVIHNAVSNFLKGKLFDSDFMISLATVVGLFANFQLEATFVMLAYQVSLLGNRIVKMYAFRQMKSFEKKIPNTAINDKNELCYVETIQKDDIILVKPGEIIPLDGRIQIGSTEVDESLIFANHGKKFANPGDLVLAGSKNLSGMISLRVSKLYDDTVIYHLNQGIKKYQQSKTKIENWSERFNQIYCPLVMIISLFLFLFPFLFLHQSYAIWIKMALIFLIVSCPIAFSLYLPISYLLGLLIASRSGIKIDGSSSLERIANMKVLFFDYESILGNTVKQTDYLGELEEEEALKRLIPLCLYLKNDCSAYLLKNYPYPIENGQLLHLRFFENGVASMKGEKELSLAFQNETLIYYEDNKKIASFIFKRTIRDNMEHFISDLKDNLHIRPILFASNEEEAKTGHNIGIEEIYVGCSNDEKNEIIKNKSEESEEIGVVWNEEYIMQNDLIKISLEGQFDSSDLCIISKDIRQISSSIHIAKTINKGLFYSMGFSLIVKIVMLVLALLGYISIIYATSIDVLTSICCLILQIYFTNRNKWN